MTRNILTINDCTTMEFHVNFCNQIYGPIVLEYNDDIDTIRYKISFCLEMHIDRFELHDINLHEGIVNVAPNDQYIASFRVDKMLSEQPCHDLCCIPEFIDCLKRSHRYNDPIGVSSDTPLIIATELNCPASVKMLLDIEGIDVNITNVRKCTAFHIAVQRKHNKIVDLFAKTRHKTLLNLNTIDYVHRTPLISAIYENREMVEMLIQCGADIEVPDNIGDTPLMIAITESNYAIDGDNSALNVVRILLKNGANVNARNTHGYTPLLYSFTVEMIDMLVAHGADIHAKNYDGDLHLKWLVKDRCELIESLIRHGINIDDVDGKGWTALMYAVRYACARTVNCLLSHGADVNIINNTGDNALFIAHRYNRNDIAKQLMEYQ